jgi:hypothetical protein
MRLGSLRRGALVLAVALGAALTPARPARAAGVAPAKATPVQREQAQSRFVKGRELYNAKKYEAALAELSASLDIISSPNTRLFIGRCLRELGRTVAAYVELGRSAVEAKELVRDDPRYEKTQQAALDERAQLEPKLGFVQITVSHPREGTVLKVGGDEVRRGGWDEPIPVLPGTAMVAVETPGQTPVRQEITLAAGDRKAMALDAAANAPAATTITPAVAAEPADHGALRPYAFAAAGVAAAGLATFAVAGIMANGTYSKLKDACGSAPCPPGHASDISAGRTQQTVANVGLVVFGVAALAGVTLFVVSMPKKTATSAATARFTAGPSFVGLKGDF